MSDVGRVRVEESGERRAEACAGEIREALDDGPLRAPANPKASAAGSRVLHLVGSTRGRDTRRCRCRAR